MKLFRVRPDEAAHRAVSIDGRTRWALPGVECPACGAEWSNIGEVYPSVDLSSLPEAEHLEDAGSEPLEAFERLREQVRPLAPPGALLLPGAELGPFTVTKASGRFADFYFPEPWWLMASPSALESLQAEGVRGLKGTPLEAGTRKLKHVPALLHLELPARGRLLPPEGQKPPCVRCGREGFTLPRSPILDAGTLPRDVDLFRLANFTTVLVATAPFIQAVERLGLKGAVFEELPVSSG